MRVRPLSVLARITAGALLFQATAPAVAVLLPVRPEPKAGRRPAGLMKVPSFPAAPAPKRVPIPGRPLRPLPPGTKTAPAFVSPTMLDERASFRCAVTGYDAEGWRRELATHPKPAREARLRIQIGEFELGRREPARSERYFREAARLLPQSSPDRGLAEYDAALSLWLQGRFSEATHEFRLLYRSPLAGFSHKSAALYAKHASACAGYHAAHRALGIRQPTRLDPLCGATSLAVALRQFGLPYAEKDVLPKVKRTGEGSSFDDLLAALPKLGMTGREVTMDERGLRAIRTPLVAYVERDHFVAVTAADASGVTYYCSDCGCWPGGKIHLTWKQWRAMDASVYLALAKAGSPKALALAHLPEKLGAKAGRIALAERGSGSLAAALAAQRALTAMAGHVATLDVGYPPYHHTAPVYCGMRGTSLHCTFESCPKYCGPQTCYGSGQGDPVNLATGEEEYSPEPDLTVYNPKGPSIVWARTYNSLANTAPSGLGSGWSHPYSGRIVRTPSGSTFTTQMIMPNGTLLSMTPATGESDPPTAASPTKAVSFGAGVPMKAVWTYSQANGRQYRITLKDQTTWVYQETYTGGNTTVQANSYYYIYYPVAILDRFGNELDLSWNGVTFRDPDPVSGQHTIPALTGFSNANGPLLTIAYDTTGGYSTIRCVSEVPPTSPSTATGYAVYYKVDTMANTGVPTHDANGNASSYPQQLDILTKVSFPKLVSSGATQPPNGSWDPNSHERYDYGYSDFSNGEINASGTYETIPYLTTISVPSGANASGGQWDGQTRAITTLSYGDPGSVSDGSVTSVTDTYGNVATFTPVANASATLVVVKGPGNVAHGTVSTSRAYYAYFANTMNSKAEVDVIKNPGAASEVSFTPATARYDDANDPYRPSSVTDGNNRTWTMSYDARSNGTGGYGNLLTSTSPKGTKTTYQYDPTFFGQPTYRKTDGLTETDTHYNPGTGTLSEVDAPVPYRAGVAAGSTQATVMDGYTTLGNPMGVTEPGNADYPTRHTGMSYGTDGYPERLGLPTKVTDAAGHFETYAYDSRGNRTSMTDRDGNVTNYLYNYADQLVEVDPPATGGHGTSRAKVQYTYLYIGGPLTVTQMLPESGGTTPVATHVTMLGLENEPYVEIGTDEYSQTTYDASYRPVNVVSGTPAATSSGVGTRFVYDLAGRLLREKGPNATDDTGYFTKNYRYDAAGNAITVMDGRAFQKNLTYADGDGLLSHVAYTYGGTLAVDAAGGYSLSNGSPATHPLGGGYDVSIAYDAYDRLQEMTDGAGDASWAYDDLGEPIGEQRTVAGLASPVYSQQYGYNPDGSLLGQTVGTASGSPAFGYAWSYRYDALGRFHSMTSPAGTSVAAYTDGGGLLQRVLPNGAYTNYAYKLGAGTTQHGLLDSMGNVSPANAVTSSFTGLAYNAQNALSGMQATDSTGAGLSGSMTYGYSDPTTGVPYYLNSEKTRLSASAVTHAYDEGLNPTYVRGVAQPAPYRADGIPAGTGAPSYDTMGNYADRGAQHDAENRMVTGPTGMVSSWYAGYRGDGMRAWKQSAGVRTVFLYDANGDPAVELDGAGNAKAVNAFDPEGLVARVDAATGASRQYQFDAQGSVAQTLSGTGAVLDARAYDAYGKELAVRTPMGIATMATDPFGFDARWGYYGDRELGTYHCGAREYDPGTARWLERDPIGLAGGVNPYSYCAANPVGSIDPSGLLRSYDISEGGAGLMSEAQRAQSGLDFDWLTPLRNWWGGQDMPGPDGVPVHVGGYCNVINPGDNIMTYNGTMHASTWDEYSAFMHNRHHQLHEEGHIAQNFSFGDLPGYGCGELLGILRELMSPGHSSRGGKIGHDYNPYEIDAERRARDRDGEWHFGSPEPEGPYVSPFELPWGRRLIAGGQ